MRSITLALSAKDLVMSWWRADDERVMEAEALVPSRNRGLRQILLDSKFKRIRQRHSD